MPRDWTARARNYVTMLAMSAALVQCAPKADANPPQPVTARIYDEFLEARKLAETSTIPQKDVPPAEREQRAAETREALQTLKAGIASKRGLLDNASRDLPDDRPNESLYFDLWSGHFGDGRTAAFKRLPGGGLEYRGVPITKDAALQCAVPARQRTLGPRAFVDCLATLQTKSTAGR